MRPHYSLIKFLLYELFNNDLKLILNDYHIAIYFTSSE